MAGRLPIECGLMGARLQSFDWASSPLGARENWPQALLANVDLVMSCPQAMLLAWSEDLICIFNDAYASLLGPGAERALGMPFPSVGAEKFSARLRSAVDAAHEGLVTREADVPLNGDYGRLTMWSVSTSPLRDGNGSIAGVLQLAFETGVMPSAVSGEDADALRKSEARHRQILDSAIDYAIIALDFEGSVTLWNEGARCIFGWTEQEILGHSAEQIFTPEDRAIHRMESEMRAALGAGVGSDERWHIRKSGERFFAHGEMTPLFDDNSRPVGFVKVLRDRTERHRAAEVLKQSEERLRRAQEAGGVGIFSVELDSDMLTGSPEFCRIFGLGDRIVLPSSEVEALVILEDRELVSDVRRRSDASAQRNVEYRIRHPHTGELRTISRQAKFERDGMGKPVRLVGVVQDVTERRGEQRAVEESAATFHAFTQAVPNHVWTAAPGGQLDWANDRAFAYSGKEPSTLACEGWQTWLHPDDLPSAIAAWSRSLETGEDYETEFRLRRADGAYRWHLSRAVPLRDATGSIARWIGTNTDIEDLRAAREALARLNATLEAQVETRTRERDRAWKNSQDLQTVIDTAGTFHAVNAAWTGVLGWKPEQVVGRSYLEFIHPEDHFSSEDALFRAKRAYLPPFENRYLHADGGYRWISWVATLEDGLIYASGRHISREKAAAAELEATQEQLRQSQKLEAVGQLTGGVAHDFNNLLTIIRSAVDLMSRRDLPDERRERYLGAISETVDRAAKLTGQLLAFARRQPLKPEIFDAGRQVESVADMVRPIVGARIEIVLRLCEEACFAQADIGQFETALINLAVNARDAMDGEGRLTIVIDHVDALPRLRGHLRRPGEFVAVSVTDTGSGIEPERLEQIFEPFYTTKEVGKGTGLGLSQVFGFAKQSNGEIEVISEIGHGSTFTIYLPRAQSAPSFGLGGAPVPGPRADGARVLVVEDNEAVGQFSTEMLQDLGYETTWVANAKEALSLLLQDKRGFDLVFSDVIMPGMNGVELASIVSERHPGLPIVLTSGYSDALAEIRGGAFQLIQKPYSVEALSRVLSAAVGPIASPGPSNA
ncbi:MAG: sensor hybrid histidine kinase [Hyphomicrobiales bacterium]|nr:sensor hybrid histidine kinase [Hyphomicrobiales bacterium]